MSKISVIGMGYVGLVGAVCLASMGHRVIGVDIDERRIKDLKNGKLPIVEPGLDVLFKKHRDKLSFSTDTTEAVHLSDICCVCVGTPSYRDGRVDISSVESSAWQIGKALREKNRYGVVVYRSTIPPGTSSSVIIPTLESVSGKKKGVDFGYAFNPEFLREGNAIEDFFHPSRTVVGCDDERVRDVLFELYRTVSGHKIHLPIEEAEIVKYVDNVWHAIKVAFANEVGYFSKIHGADGRLVMDVFCKDRKLNLSSYYLKPGFAFGGSCLPKDVRGFTTVASQRGIKIPLVSSVMLSNHAHIQRAVDLIFENVPEKETVVIVGVSFKAYTDDIRETPAMYLARELKKRGYPLLYYDTFVRAEHVKRYFGEKFIEIDGDEFLSSIDEVFNYKYLVFTGSYRDVPLDVELYKNRWVFDLNGLFYGLDAIKQVCNYHGMCW